MIIKLLTEHHLELLGLKGGCRGSSESTHVKMPHCWKSHALAQKSFEVNYIPNLDLMNIYKPVCYATNSPHIHGVLSSPYFT